MAEGWTHEYTFPIPAGGERIFAALTDEAELKAWFAEHARVEAHQGGAYRFWGRHTLGAPKESDADGRITGLEPGRRVSFEWQPFGVASEVSISLAPQEVGEMQATAVTVRHELRADLGQPRAKELIDDWWRLSLGNLMAHTTGRAQVLRPDFTDRNPEIRLNMHMDAPPEAVFRALIEPDAVREWFGAPNPVIEARVGGRYELGWTYTVDGREVAGGPMHILEIVPNERLVVDWPDWRGDASVPRQSVTWLLSRAGGGTDVTLIHAGFIRAADMSDYPFGWGHFLSEMSKVAGKLGVAT